MGITTADVTAKMQWDALVAIIDAERATGLRLEGVNYVARAYDLWTPNPPTIGVQLVQYPLSPLASMQRKMISEFWILVGMHSTNETAAANMGPGTPANLEDAMNQLEPFVAPGNGKGLIAVLTDVGNYTLLGSANRSLPSTPKYMWTVNPGENPQIWAYAHIVFTAEAVVSVFQGS